ncbi:MAG: FecR domain-containing protein [Planctomycetaceae bacterium]|nr:FecR domain-containing protein [Planctomycetales bacterium]MCB9924738.1 FecR domain-containing protein [Planctomycetaceae bacterium]
MNSDERTQLIDSLLDGDISDADFLRLEAELSIDSNARREYYERVKLSLLLENVAGEYLTTLPSKPVSAQEAAAVTKYWRWAFSLMAVVAAALFISLGLQFAALREDQHHPAEHPSNGLASSSVENAVTGFAVVSGQADAVWGAAKSLGMGSLVSTGELHLLSGVVQLELFSGVSIVVEGDAVFSVVSPMEVAVARGKIRARVPEPAHGFRIRTDEGDVIDLGTEFALNVNDEGSEVHVLDGEIEWQPQGAEPQKMEQGESLRRLKDGRSVAATDSEFVGVSELKERLQVEQSARFDRWEQFTVGLRQDPRLLAYYQITNGNLSARRLPNLALGSGVTSSEGAVVAAVAAPGRWGQTDGALDFSPAGSRVRLSIPGEYQSLTLLCWVRINSLDRWYNSLFLTDGHEEGEPHWQIMDDGRLFFSVKKRDVFDRSKGELDKHVYYSPKFWDSSLSGQWLMVATVYDVDAMQVTHFLNGQVLSQEAIPREYLVESVRIGNASLCNWGLPEKNQPKFAVRNLNGSLDEFALFAAALSADEIQELYDVGRP